MASSAPRRVLVICHSAPRAGTGAREALDMALAFAAFEQPVSLLFAGEGVWCLLDGQEPPEGSRPVARLLGALPDYGIGTLLAEQTALAARGLSAARLLPGVSPLDDAGVAAAIAAHDLVFQA